MKNVIAKAAGVLMVGMCVLMGQQPVNRLGNPIDNLGFVTPDFSCGAALPKYTPCHIGAEIPEGKTGEILRVETMVVSVYGSDGKPCQIQFTSIREGSRMLENSTNCPTEFQRIK
jgi:hypothetical protein